MKKLESSLQNMLLVLTGITVIAVGILAYVNELTKEPIAAANAKTLQDAIRALVPGFDNNPIDERKKISSNGQDFTIYPATKSGKSLGAAVEAKTMGYGGELTVLVGFKEDGSINDYSILSHSETPGLGAKATQWFKKGQKGDIIGKNPGETQLTVSKDGGSIDAITASTITSRAFLKAVNNAYSAYIGQTDAISGATQHSETNQLPDSITNKENSHE